jgi:hypothetical protein
MRDEASSQFLCIDDVVLSVRAARLRLITGPQLILCGFSQIEDYKSFFAGRIGKTLVKRHYLQ